MTQYFLDTNILWWYFVQTSKHHHRVKKFLDPLILNIENGFLVNEFVIIELIHHLIKKKGKQGYKIARLLLSGKYPFFEIRYDILQLPDLKQVLEIVHQYGTTTSIGGRDASIIHSMTVHGVRHIITNDQAFENVEDVIVSNPVPAP